MFDRLTSTAIGLGAWFTRGRGPAPLISPSHVHPAYYTRIRWVEFDEKMAEVAHHAHGAALREQICEVLNIIKHTIFNSKILSDSDSESEVQICLEMTPIKDKF